MVSLFNIWNVARIETKTLFRSWFFRIFSVLSITLLIFINLGLYTEVGPQPWSFRGIPSSIPYLNLLLVNVVQAIIAVFLASDFLKRDKKLDTTEVIYMRSMTNGDYVIGKSIAVIFVFLVLNVAVLFVVAIYNIFFAGVPVKFIAYLIYPLVISLPTLIYILGLSFFMMILIRNQAVTFIILLGYIAITLFFLGHRFHGLFDYISIFAPLMYSDFIGFGNFNEILIHRGIYFFLGLSFTFATIFFLKRLPQSQSMTKTSLAMAVLFFILGIFMGYQHFSSFISAKRLRQTLRESYQVYTETAKVTPIKHDIHLKHMGSEIKCVSTISFKNSYREPIETYFFTLNPGLKVKKVENSQTELQYTQNLNIIEIKPSVPLASGLYDSLSVYYEGEIYEDACYIDVTEEEREEPYRMNSYRIDKRYAFIRPNFVLLTPENIWYPTPNTRFNPEHPEKNEKDFIHFHLRVETDRNLRSISQGESKKTNDGSYSFLPEMPLPAISLAIGSYKKRALKVDSVDYCLYTLENHDYYTNYLGSLSDTLGALIKEIKQDYESKLLLEYPYKRLQIIETPIQFYAHSRLWTISQETVQPEIIFLPENGVSIRNADFKQSLRFEKKQRERSNQVITEIEMQSNIFRRFVESTFTSGVQYGFRMGGGSFPSTNLKIFPNYYTFVNNLESEKWPILNIALEAYLNSRIEAPSSPFEQLFRDMTDEDKTNLALADQNIHQLLTDPDMYDIAGEALKIKGKYLFSIFENKIGSEDFSNFINQFLKQNEFKPTLVNQFISELEEQFDYNAESYIEDWYRSNELPSFLISNTTSYNVLDEDRTRTQITFSITNTSSIEGIVQVTFIQGRRGGFFGRGPGQNEPDYEQLISVSPDQTKEIGFVLDFEPRRMMINTLISKNLPAIINTIIDDLEVNEKAKPFEGENILYDPVQLKEPNEIIVDNEDSGFEVLSRTKASFLAQTFASFKKNDEERYIGINFWDPPRRWRATASSQFFGNYIRSAHYIKSGEGDNKVIWKTTIKENGFYDIYCYSTRIIPPWMRRRGREGGSENERGEYHFTIHHDDGEDETILELKNADEGWNYLGNLYLSAGEAKVELSNKSKADLIFADAIKWAKK